MLDFSKFCLILLTIFFDSCLLISLNSNTVKIKLIQQQETVIWKPPPPDPLGPLINGVGIGRRWGVDEWQRGLSTHIGLCRGRMIELCWSQNAGNPSANGGGGTERTPDRVPRQQPQGQFLGTPVEGECDRSATGQRELPRKEALRWTRCGLHNCCATDQRVRAHADCDTRENTDESEADPTSGGCSEAVIARLSFRARLFC